MTDPLSELWDERLMCRVLSLTYDFRSQTGRLHMADGDCCDMEGCVALFQGIDPQATTIKTFSGSIPDMIYHKHGGDWSALVPAR